MDFSHSERSLALQKRRVEEFMQVHVYPAENAYDDEVHRNQIGQLELRKYRSHRDRPGIDRTEARRHACTSNSNLPHPRSPCAAMRPCGRSR